jgi:hypothetical protein
MDFTGSADGGEPPDWGWCNLFNIPNGPRFAMQAPERADVLEPTGEKNPQETERRDTRRRKQTQNQRKVWAKVECYPDQVPQQPYAELHGHHMQDAELAEFLQRVLQGV